MADIIELLYRDVEKSDQISLISTLEYVSGENFLPYSNGYWWWGRGGEGVGLWKKRPKKNGKKK